MLWQREERRPSVRYATCSTTRMSASERAALEDVLQRALSHDMISGYEVKDEDVIVQVAGLDLVVDSRHCMAVLGRMLASGWPNPRRMRGQPGGGVRPDA
jgi:hypothetical protein